MAADYGATIAGVRRRLAGLTISASSTPSEPDVAAWLAEHTADVYANLGSLDRLGERLVAAGLYDSTDAADLVEALELRARAIVHALTASTAWAAAYPDRVAKQEQSYSALLAAEAATALGKLRADVEALSPGDLPANAGPSLPAHSFPRDPIFRLAEDY